MSGIHRSLAVSRGLDPRRSSSICRLARFFRRPPPLAPTTWDLLLLSVWFSPEQAASPSDTGDPGKERSPVDAPKSRPQATDTFDLFVMAGQSNMQGWQGDAERYPEDPKHLDQEVPFYWVAPGHSSSDGRWTTLRAQGGRFPKGHFGPEITFARELRRAGLRPAIFKFALGSTGLTRDWREPGAGGWYDQLVQELRGARARFDQDGHHARLGGLVWIQGESDAETDELAKNYIRRLQRLLEDFRGTVAKNRRLPVLLGVDEAHPWVQRRPQLVDSQKRLVETDPSAIFTSLKGLPKADSSHLTPAGLEAHGKRLAEAYLELAKRLRAE